MLLRNAVLAALDPPRVASGDLRIESGALGESGPNLPSRPHEETVDLAGALDEDPNYHERFHCDGFVIYERRPVSGQAD